MAALPEVSAAVCARSREAMVSVPRFPSAGRGTRRIRTKKKGPGVAAEALFFE